MSTNFEQRKQTVWARAQKDLGFYAPPEVREAIDIEAGPVRDSEDLEYYKGTVILLLHIAKLQAIVGHLPPQRNNSNNRSKSKPRPRALRKRLYLVEFVIDHQLAVKSRKKTSRRRINWKQICNEWNDAHSYDPMTPPVLKATYYRAAADKYVQINMFKNQLKVVGQSLEKAVEEMHLNQPVLDTVEKLLRIPKNKIPSSLQGKYEMFLTLLGDALENIQLEAQNE